MMRAVITRWLGGAGLVMFGAGCAPPVTVVKTRPVEPPPAVLSAPKATPEEVGGEVPPLRPLADVVRLVPKEFIPPAPPADPAPELD